jgi:phospholipid/cholesterol/gamma-HCH transport system substrate-binding protein
VKRSNSDLIVGGVIFISLFILIAGILWLKEASISRKMSKYTVLFPNVGHLQPGNPVKVNGVRQGSVSKIYLHESKVAVEIKLNREVVITDSCRFVVQNIGIMGERMIGIQLAKGGKRHPPDTKGDINYIDGFFDSGIAEAMGMMGSVLNQVEALVDSVEEIIRETVGNTEFITFFNTIVNRLDTIILVVDNLVKGNERKINTSLSNVHTITADVKGLLKENRDNVTSIVNDGSQLTQMALNIAERVDSITVSVNSIMSDIESGQGSIGMLVEDETVVRDLKQAINDLDSLVKDINDDALKLRIKLFGNRKYFRKKKNK